jgi:hypothetical protein
MQMISYLIPSPTDQKPIKADFYNVDSDSTLIFVGGDGDGKNKFDPIIKRLFSKGYQSNILTYTYRGLDEGEQTSLNQKTIDLEEVLDFAQNKLGTKTIKLFCTSMGSWATVKVIINKRYNKFITDVFLLDPCDYYQKESAIDTEIAYHWKGYENYKPEGPVLSDHMKGITSDVRVRVVSLIVRNYSRNGYNSDKSLERGKTTDGFYPRLNIEMVKAFYAKTPDKNKGGFVELDNLPHAFMRDGDVHDNVQRISKLILQYL